MFPFHTENVEENNYKQDETGRIEASTMSSPLNHISRRPSFGASSASSCSIHLVFSIYSTIYKYIYDCDWTGNFAAAAVAAAAAAVDGIPDY